MTAPDLALNVRLTNYYAVRNKLLELDALYRGAFRDAVNATLAQLRDYAHMITHKETGTLARSHTIEYDARALSGNIYPSPRYMKRHGGKFQYADEYGVYEHSRGGSHAFYERTGREMGPTAAMTGINVFLGRMRFT